MNTNDILVSIITVTYNSEQTLEDTIQSIINQSYKNIEYIIIDGGSTDNTLNIIEKYKQHISYWISEPDKGIYDAMNKGIQKAKGELIGIINSDDWYEKDIISTVVSKYKKYGDNCIYHGNIKFHYNNGLIEWKKPQLNLNKFYRGTILFHPTFFVPKKLYTRIGLFDIKFKIAADYDFMIRSYKEGIKYIYIDKYISNMRAGGESTQKAILGYKETAVIANKAGLKKWKILLFTGIKIAIYKFNKFKGKLQ